ncbi:DUF1189 family protein [Alkalicoccobacillus porphyridii]|uniref:DUF1189 domain-containing protein n=1 Tax=Alkalicoccobacillus porphyridii TaxID=2597270 RepID=A0A553ZZ58_9BACI|nr:DUF1189 family protein [Alkalicoccobacillus porphyridii]TSB46727.1 DUF1189 domain-containing protein [Alkalicoccobacillus porphyridii]
MNFFSWFRKCFYHRQTVLASRFRPTIHVLGHVCFTVILALLPFCIVLSSSIWSGFSLLHNSLEHPEVSFSIHDDQLVHPLNSLPLSVDTGSLQVIVDPNEEYSLSESQDEVLLLHQETARLILPNFKQELPYSVLGQEPLTKEDIISQIEGVQSFLPILLSIMTLIIIVIVIASAFIGSSLLTIVALPFYRKKKNIQFIHLWKISVHTLPLPLILYAWMVTWLNELSITWFFLPYIGFYGYMLFLLSRKKKSRKTN